MKAVPVLILMCFTAISCIPAKSTIVIPPQSSLEVDFPDYELYEARINNKSRNAIEVKVMNKKTEEGIRGFGLSGLGKAKVMVEQEASLSLLNSAKFLIIYHTVQLPNPQWHLL